MTTHDMMTKEQYAKAWETFKHGTRTGNLNRDRAKIVYDALKCLPCSKTHIQYNANMSFTQLNKIIGMMLEKQLLEMKYKDYEENDDRRNPLLIFACTPKGEQFIKGYEQIDNLLK